MLPGLLHTRLTASCANVQRRWCRFSLTPPVQRFVQGGQDTVRGATGMADASTIVHHRGTTGTTPRARRELSLGERSRPPVASDETLGCVYV